MSMKQRDLELIRSFAEDLPRDSYLWDYFAGGLLVEIEEAIKNDMHLTSWKALWEQQHEATAEINKLGRQKLELAEEVHSLRGTLAKLHESLESIYATAHKILETSQSK